MATRMTEEAARVVRTRFSSTSQSLNGAALDLRALQEEISSGAGEFRPEISDDAGNFQRSWRSVLEILSDSSAVIAGNTNAQYLDLTDVDNGS
ncbi:MULTISPECIES: hypothetical protein [unclassified Nocardioides]|uniref:hypothetical protein n=1 Tax=unclassified Nocardioides TaxID=2615069 RepID=UPI0006FA6316|nr:MULTISPECIES: hypothetical protein [unclassified Nocardioides]KQY64691.1 hypothetical protein ASD30_07245 [Nocardioides sp. Root140]KQZ67328.1 hypothetical protein ASD66_20460 [Nocardioides sp. Root151]KRF12594.1 hypothetical protein ASH02_13600 [Nocardioides sp. Soil796]